MKQVGGGLKECKVRWGVEKSGLLFGGPRPLIRSIWIHLYLAGAVACSFNSPAAVIILVDGNC